MGITIKDIAKMANVSKGTVSRVINGKPGVGEDTRKRIIELIKAVNFQPNASAQGLAAKRSFNIGVIIPHTGSYSLSTTYWPFLLTAINEYAAAKDYNVVLATTRSEDDIDSAYRSILKGQRIDGLIVGAEQFGDKQLAALLLKDFPFVMVGKSPNISHFHVDVDNTGGAYQITKHLVNRGHSNILMLAGPKPYLSVQERVNGFRNAMSEAGLNTYEIINCPYQEERAYALSQKALKSYPKIDAIFAAAGDLVPGVLKALRNLKLRVPQDVALASFDDHPLYDFFSPRITTIRQPIEQLGRVAAELLFKLMEGEEVPIESLLLPTELIIRDSCGENRNK